MQKGFLATVSLLTGILVGTTIAGKVKNQAVEANAKRTDKFKGYYNILNEWLILKREGKSLEDYFVKKGYKTIAIYGMGELGRRLYEELKDSNQIKVKYAIDKSLSIYSELEILNPKDDMPEVDAVVVTATFAFHEIMEALCNKTDAPIVSMDDVVCGGW